MSLLKIFRKSEGRFNGPEEARSELEECAHSQHSIIRDLETAPYGANDDQFTVRVVESQTTGQFGLSTTLSQQLQEEYLRTGTLLHQSFLIDTSLSAEYLKPPKRTASLRR